MAELPLTNGCCSSRSIGSVSQAVLSLSQALQRKLCALYRNQV